MNLEILKNRIKNTGVIQEGDRIVLGLSGGPDSVCLFYVLNSLKDELKLDIHCVHINHGLRGKDSDADEDFVKTLCEKFEIPLMVRKVNCIKLASQWGLSTEETGRKVRYRAFAECAFSIIADSADRGSEDKDFVRENSMMADPKKSVKVSTGIRGLNRSTIGGKVRLPKIAIAQNFDDQAETILYRIVRGTGIGGLKAMSPESRLDSAYYRDLLIDGRGKVNCPSTLKSSAGFADSVFLTDYQGLELRIIRPLLNISKEDILTALMNESIKFCLDKTNNEAVYARNKIRLKVIPEMREINPSVEEAIVRLGRIASESDDFLACESEKLIGRMKQSGEIINGNDHISFSVLPLINSHRALAKKIISMAINKLGLEENVSYDHLEGIWALLTSQNPSAQLDLPGGYVACRLYENIGIFSPDFFSRTVDDLKLKISPPGEAKTSADFVSDNTEGNINSNSDYQNVEIFISQKTLEDRYGKGMQLVLRYRRPGDYIYLANGDRKKIKNLLIDDKVPRIMRNFVPLLAVGSEVIWIGDIFGKTKGRVAQHFRLRSQEGDDLLTIEILM